MDDQFCYVIFWWDADGDPDEVYMDSVWTRNADAIARMKKLHSSLLADGEKVDWNFNPAFPFAEDTNIKWMLNDTDWDPKRGIYCKRIFLNPKRLLDDEEQKD